MGTILHSDPGRAEELANLLLDFVQNDLGYTAEELIPALMLTCGTLALDTADPQQALDEAVAWLGEREDV